LRQLYEYQPVVGFRFIPDIKARVRHEGGGYLIRTNSSGFRSDVDFAPTRTPGKKRILLFGDSYTAGEGVSNGRRYSDYLERGLPNLEVYNFGLPATGTDQHYLIYKEYAESIEHDALVIAVFVENIRRVASQYRYFLDDTGTKRLYEKPYYSLVDGDLTLNAVPPRKRPIDVEALPEEERAKIATTVRFPRLRSTFDRMRHNPTFEKLVVDGGLRDRLLGWSGYQPVPEYDDAAHPAWQVMQQVIGTWIQEHPKPVMLMPIPIYHYVAGIADPSKYQQRLRDATEEAGGTFFDPLPALQQYSKHERRSFFYAGDGHLTSAGNEALAEALLPAVRDMIEGRTPA